MSRPEYLNFRITEHRTRWLDALLRRLELEPTPGNYTIALDYALARATAEERKMTLYYTIDEGKLARVVELFNEQVDPRATDDLIRAEVRAAWYEGQEQQEWIDSADPQEIVDWLATFY